MLHKILTQIKENGILSTMSYTHHWIIEKYYERHLGIDTSGVESLEELGLDDNNKNYHGHQSIEYRGMVKALKSIQLQPGRDIFLDYGSGKGRAVIVAAMFPFRKVIGVELSSKLNESARRNVETARKKLICKDIEIITANAISYEIPDDVSVINLYNPFQGEILAAVQKQILTSLARTPRGLTVIFRYPEWVPNAFSDMPEYSLVSEVACFTSTGERMLIYESNQT